MVDASGDAFSWVLSLQCCTRTVTAGGGQASEKEAVVREIRCQRGRQESSACRSKSKSVGQSEREGWGRCPENRTGNKRPSDAGRDAGLRGLPWMRVKRVAPLSLQTLPAGGFSYPSAQPCGVTDHLKHCSAFSTRPCVVLPTGKGIFHQCST